MLTWMVYMYQINARYQSPKRLAEGGVKILILNSRRDAGGHLPQGPGRPVGAAPGSLPPISGRPVGAAGENPLGDFAKIQHPPRVQLQPFLFKKKESLDISFLKKKGLQLHPGRVLRKLQSSRQTPADGQRCPIVGVSKKLAGTNPPGDFVKIQHPPRVQLQPFLF